jgi:hypothetical protein
LLSLGVKSELTSAFALLAGVLLARFLALTIRFLPLLSGLLAATLLLAGLLTRVLVLLTLTRVLILAGHSGSPFVDPSPDNSSGPRLVPAEFGFHRNYSRRRLRGRNPCENNLVQPSSAPAAAVAGSGSHLLEAV